MRLLSNGMNKHVPHTSGEFETSGGASSLDQKGRGEDGMEGGSWTLPANSTSRKQADRIGLKACWLS